MLSYFHNFYSLFLSSNSISILRSKLFILFLSSPISLSALSLPPSIIASTKIELINDIPIIAPITNIEAKNILLKSANIGDAIPFATASAIDVNSNAVNIINIEYIELNGSEKYSGAISLNNEQLNNAEITIRMKNPISTA